MKMADRPSEDVAQLEHLVTTHKKRCVREEIKGEGTPRKLATATQPLG
jgi:hypothetical protein